MPKTFDELMKSLQATEADLITKHVNALETKVTDLTKSVADKDVEIVDLKEQLEKAKKAPEVKDEDAIALALKNASPALVAHIEGLQRSVQSLVADQQNDLAAKRFDLVKAIPAEEATLKDILKSASPATFEILCKAAKAIEEGLLKTNGKTTSDEPAGGAEGKAYAKLEKAAKALMVATPALPFESAFLKACEMDPVTYAEHRKELQ